MTSNRPYLIRALYDWIVDNDRIPQIIVTVAHAGVDVPNEFAREGKIVLNIGPGAVEGLDLGNEWVMFSARFRGRSRFVKAPVSAVLGIFARHEPGQEQVPGLVFQDEESDGPPPPPPTPTPTPKRKRPSFKVVK